MKKALAITIILALTMGIAYLISEPTENKEFCPVADHYTYVQFLARGE